MDKVKVILAVLKKHHFWVMSVVAAADWCLWLVHGDRKTVGRIQDQSWQG